MSNGALFPQHFYCVQFHKCNGTGVQVLSSLPSNVVTKIFFFSSVISRLTIILQTQKSQNGKYIRLHLTLVPFHFISSLLVLCATFAFIRDELDSVLFTSCAQNIYFLICQINHSIVDSFIHFYSTYRTICCNNNGILCWAPLHWFIHVYLCIFLFCSRRHIRRVVDWQKANVHGNRTLLRNELK